MIRSKRFIFFFLIMFTNIFGYAQKHYLKGKPKSMKETTVKTYDDPYYGKIFYTSEIVTLSIDSLGRTLIYRREAPRADTIHSSVTRKSYYNEHGIVDYREILYVNKDSVNYRETHESKDGLHLRSYYTFVHNYIEHVYDATYEYNDKKNRTASHYSYFEKFIDSEEKNFHILTEYEYNKDGWLVVEDSRKSVNRKDNFLIKFKRNKNGLTIQKKFYDINNKKVKTIKYKYKFDNQGNWTERKSYSKKDLIEVVYRELDYYDSP